MLISICNIIKFDVFLTTQTSLINVFIFIFKKLYLMLYKKLKDYKNRLR